MGIKNFRTRKIQRRSVGARVKMARKRKKISFSEAEVQTKIHEKFLRAIETDNFNVLPAEVYANGYFKKYVEFLNLKPEIVAEFKSEFRLWRKNESQLLIGDRLKEPRMIITPKIILGFLSFAMVGVIVGYLYLQISTLTSPPSLDIILPSGKEVVRVDMIEIIGKVDQNAKILINNELVALSGAGEFSQQVKLADGVNNIQIIAENRFSKKTIKNLQILKSRGDTNTKI